MFMNISGPDISRIVPIRLYQDYTSVPMMVYIVRENIKSMERPVARWSCGQMASGEHSGPDLCERGPTMTVEIEGIETGMHLRKRDLSVRPSWEGMGPDYMGWQKEILWMVVTEGVTDRAELVERLEEMGARNVDVVIEGMIGNGLIEDINGYLRIHPNFAENCYAIIRG